MTEGSAFYWRGLHDAGRNIILGNRKRCGRKFKGVQYADLILDSLTIQHRSLKGTVQDCVEHALTHPDAVSAPTSSSIHRFVHSEVFAALKGSDLSFKNLTVRGPNTNTPTNKDLRIQRVTDLQHRLNDGFLWIAVDETAHSRKSWGFKGQRTYLYNMRRGSTQPSLPTRWSSSKQSVEV